MTKAKIPEKTPDEAPVDWQKARDLLTLDVPHIPEGRYSILTPITVGQIWNTAFLIEMKAMNETLLEIRDELRRK